VGESQGGLPPDALVEREDAALRDMRRVIETFHDPSPFSMLRVACAPCSPFSVSQDFMRESAALARASGVGLHTHLRRERRRRRVHARALRMHARPNTRTTSGWTGREVWHAHCVKLDDGGIRVFAQTQTGVAHCPTSNMRLASGIAPVRRMRDAGVSVGLGVDGSASNDSSHLLAEARQALLLARVCSNAGALDAREALWMATRGGASVLGRNDIGLIAPGMAADIVAFDLDDLAYAGAMHDPLAALAFCAPTRAWLSIVNGSVIVRDGRLTTVDTERLAERHNRLAQRLLS
jgi:cytosine/adenosine deaminase-related metal-dependent hydrolase